MSAEGDHAALLADLSAGVKVLTGMLGLTVALLPTADRAFVLNALAALQADGGEPGQGAAAQALSVLVERFSVDVANARAAGDPPRA